MAAAGPRSRRLLHTVGRKAAVRIPGVEAGAVGTDVGEAGAVGTDVGEAGHRDNPAAAAAGVAGTGRTGRADSVVALCAKRYVSNALLLSWKFRGEPEVAVSEKKSEKEVLWLVGPTVVVLFTAARAVLV